MKFHKLSNDHLSADRALVVVLSIVSKLISLITLAYHRASISTTKSVILILDQGELTEKASFAYDMGARKKAFNHRVFISDIIPVMHTDRAVIPNPSNIITLVLD